MQRRWFMGVTATLTLFIAGSAFSAPGSSEAIYACLNTASGTLARVSIGTPSECPGNHLLIRLQDAVRPLDHGELGGLDQDDHRQYLPVDPGTRALVDDLNAEGHRVTNLAPGAASGDAVVFQQGVKVSDPAGGDLSGAFPVPTVTGLQGRPVEGRAPAAGDLLMWDGSAWTPSPLASPSVLSSPNGEYTISLSDTGILLTGPTGHISLGPSGVSIVGPVIELNGSPAP